MAPFEASALDLTAKPSPNADDTTASGEARLKECKLQWTAANANGDGVLDASEIARYNTTIRTAKQAVLPENARLTEDGCLAART